MSQAIASLHRPVQGLRDCEHAAIGEWCPTAQIGKFGPLCGDDPDKDYSTPAASHGGRVPVTVCEHCILSYYSADLPDGVEDDQAAVFDDHYHRIWPCPTILALSPMIRIEWDAASPCVLAFVALVGVGEIRLNKFGSDPWYMEHLELAADGLCRQVEFNDHGEGSPQLPESALQALLDNALDCFEFTADTCDCDEGRCHSLREHAVRRHEEEKRFSAAVDLTDESRATELREVAA